MESCTSSYESKHSLVARSHSWSSWRVEKSKAGHWLDCWSKIPSWLLRWHRKLALKDFPRQIQTKDPTIAIDWWKVCSRMPLEMSVMCNWQMYPQLRSDQEEICQLCGKCMLSNFDLEKLFVQLRLWLKVQEQKKTQSREGRWRYFDSVWSSLYKKRW